MRNSPELAELDGTRLEEVLRRVEQSLDEEDSAPVRAVFLSYAYLAELVEDRNTSIRRLRQLSFGASAETTKAVVGRNAEKPEAAVPPEAEAEAETGSAACEGNTHEPGTTACSRGLGATAPRLTGVPRGSS